nr:uncharacterized protein LOC9266548 isoform X2 [Oryza sativa Japonica Group]
MFIYAPIRRPVPRRHRLRRTVAGTGRTPRRTPRTPLPSPSLVQFLPSPPIRHRDAVHSAGHDLRCRRDASLPSKGRYCAKFIPNQNYPFPIRIVMLSALSKCSPIQLSTQANINKVLTCNTPLLIPSSLLNKKDSERMEDNMMYPIKDQETMLAVPMDMNRQQQDTVCSKIDLGYDRMPQYMSGM